MKLQSFGFRYPGYTAFFNFSENESDRRTLLIQTLKSRCMKYNGMETYQMIDGESLLTCSPILPRISQLKEIELMHPCVDRKSAAIPCLAISNIERNTKIDCN